MPNCVSLFTGAGGFDIGLHQAGFKVIFATDIEPLCEATYRHPNNFGKKSCFHVGNISDVSRKTIEKVIGSDLMSLDLLVGGPPCPSYSKSRFYRTEKPRGINDPIGDETMRGYLRLLKELKPQAFIFENVAGFAYKAHPEGFDLLTKTAEKLGYTLSHEVINAADYGVPQIRQRFIMVGMKDRKFSFPKPTRINPELAIVNKRGRALPVWETASSVLDDLDTAENENDTGHFAGGKYHDLLCQVPEGDNYLFFTEKRDHPNPVFLWRSRYWSFLLKLARDKPSWTIQARRSNNMGPFHWKNRILRIEEVKRIQTFPDHWMLAGTVEQQWRQIGNAVPPLLAKIIGKEIIKQLK